MSESSAAARATVATPDRGVAIQLLLVLDVGIRLALWTVSLTITMWVAARYAGWGQFAWSRLGEFVVAWDIGQRVGHMLLVFNVVYVLLLVLVRLLVPTPEPGQYSTAGRGVDRKLFWMSFLWVLTRARYQPPFPAFLVPQLANLAPLRWLMGWQFGPHSKSPFFIDPNVLDPGYLTIGKNVTIGFGTSVTAHLQDRRAMLFQPTVIEDDVLVGAHCGIPGGVTIKRGAVIRAYSVLQPGTVVGENEFWGGIPAVKIQDLKPLRG